MAEKHHVLSVLVKTGPGCAAELDERLHEDFGLLGSTTEMVDRGLVELCGEGLIEGTGEIRELAGVESRRRVVYAVTEEGMREIDRWMKAPSDPIADVVASITREFDWIRSMEGPEELPALIEQAQRREARARADLGTTRRVPSDELHAGDRPWPEVARDIARNMEVDRLEAEIETMVEMQALAREMLSETGSEQTAD